MGTDFEGTPLFPHGENAVEFELMVRGGMSESDVIVAATSTNAAILGIEKDIGKIEVGKVADLIAVPGNPLKDITALCNAEFVMQDGRIAYSKISNIRAADDL